MLVRHDNGLGGRERALDLLLPLREVWLFDTTAEEFMDLQVHAAVDHDRTVGIDDLIGGARLDARLARRALDREVLGAAALGELHNVDAQGKGARHRLCGLADRAEIGAERLGGSRYRCNKRKQRNGQQVSFHRDLRNLSCETLARPAAYAVTSGIRWAQ